MPQLSASRPHPTPTQRWQIGFLALMPTILNCASHAFRHLDADSREEATQEVLANTLQSYVRLVQRGKVAQAYPSTLARFAIAQYFAGRQVGCQQNSRDLLSPAAQRKHGLQVQSLHNYDQAEQCWREVLVEARQAGPAETAAVRIDFADWLASLSSREREIAEKLADGSSTQEVARQFGVSSARISQLRQELRTSWEEFHARSEEETELNHQLLSQNS